MKTVLAAYRPNHRDDAADPAFAEALRAVEHDPELASWFEEAQRFDAHAATVLRQLPAPAGLKELILLNAREAGKTVPFHTPAWRRQAGSWLAMAALLALAFALGRLTLPRGAASGPDGGNAADRLALQAIAYTDKMPALQFVCFDASEVAQWVDEKSAALHMGKLLDKPMSSMQMIGSSTAQWDGKPVIMVALQNGNRMAMLYLVRAVDFPEAVQGAGGVMEKDGWVSKTGRDGEHLYILTTKGTRDSLDFPMPL